MARFAASFGTEGVAVVTGGGSGIGRALAQQLAAGGVGTIVVADRNLAAAQETRTLIGNPGHAIELNVADRHSVASAAEAIARDFGPITAWFSNAGIHSGTGLGTAADWNRAIEVNLLGHVNAADTVLRSMEAQGRGIFVITASAAGLLTDLRTATYSATKHAAVGLAEWLAASVVDGVSVHCLCPEGVVTGMTRPDSANAAPEISFLSAEEVAARTLEGVAAGTFLILTHPNTSEFEQRRAADRQRWLNGMRRARRSTLHLDRIFPSAAGV